MSCWLHGCLCEQQRLHSCRHGSNDLQTKQRKVHDKECLNAPHAWQVEKLGTPVALCGSVGRLLCLGALLHHPHHCSPEPHQCKALLHPVSVCLSVGLIVSQLLRLSVCPSVIFYACECVCLFVPLF